MGGKRVQPTAIVLSGGLDRCTGWGRRFGASAGACSEWSWCNRSSKSLDFFIGSSVFVNTAKLMRMATRRI